MVWSKPPLPSQSTVTAAEPPLGNPTSPGQILTSTTNGTRSWISLPASLDPALNLSDLSNPAQALTNLGAEPVLGNPPVDGYVLTSTAAGVRSWQAMPQGGPTGALLAVNNLTDVSNPAQALVNLGAEPALGVPAATGYLLSSDTAGNRTWVAPATATGGSLMAANNLSDLVNPAAALLNLGAEPALPNPGPAGQVLTSNGFGGKVWTTLPTVNLLPYMQRSLNLSDVYNTAQARANINAEQALGNPTTANMVLTSTTTGVRSWVDVHTLTGILPVSGNPLALYTFAGNSGANTGTAALSSFAGLSYMTVAGNVYASGASAILFPAITTGEFTIEALLYFSPVPTGFSWHTYRIELTSQYITFLSVDSNGVVSVTDGLGSIFLATGVALPANTPVKCIISRKAGKTSFLSDVSGALQVHASTTNTPYVNTGSTNLAINMAAEGHVSNLKIYDTGLY